MDAAYLRHEFAPREFLLHQLPQRLRQLIQALDPAGFVAVGADERYAFAGRADGKGAHRYHAFAHAAVGGGQYQPAEGVALQSEIRRAHHSSFALCSIVHAGSTVSSRSTSMLRAWASYRR